MIGLGPNAHSWVEAPGGGRYCFQCGTDWWDLREKTSTECPGAIARNQAEEAAIQKRIDDAVGAAVEVCASIVEEYQGKGDAIAAAIRARGGRK